VARILVIEQDEALQVRIGAALEGAGFKVTTANDTLGGLKSLYESYPDLVIMARDLPMVSGEEPCLRLRVASYLPLIVLGSGSEAAETLELGADAYMAKPPSLVELVARVRALLRRKLRNGPLVGGTGSETDDGSWEDGDDLNGLKSVEFRLASCLFHNRGRLLSYTELIRGVWGNREVSLDTLHYHMRHLQQKLLNSGISMFRGVGYCFYGDS
jgi:DNA-binding response OmpR family regulator